MSYPQPRYLAKQGEASAQVRTSSEPPGYTTAKGTAGHYLASTHQTDGLFSLFRWEMSATSGGPSPHFHRSVSETFYVLNGIVRLYDGRDWFNAHPGDLIYVPPGGIHAFTNTSGAPASMLMMLAPGADREAYFAELTELAASGHTLTDDEWANLFARHDTVLVNS
ncbi:cupin domain-containing protein [Arthrobacter castelli]|uniref:cupin domain-containing protein n=1 Tax=Arthrobacter castelli TaxID=271431 RepID=UPI00041F48FA|nr:cupin domain-containing protein [Arthrobacter castelli]